VLVGLYPTVASVAFLTVAAALFWACTTQIWHLP
jgi:hypothetical protein